MISMTSFGVTVATVALLASFVPRSDADAAGLVPGESAVYSNYTGIVPPYPTNNSGTDGPGLDDLLFQNLLSTDWIVFNFYQKGVEALTASSFTDAGYKSTSYERITHIRDNDAGHLLIFRNSISRNSLKPGHCSYQYGRV